MAAKTVTFESDLAHYMLVREPKTEIPLPTGTGWQTVQKGITYKFDPVPSPKAKALSGLIGVLTVKAGQDKRTTDSESWLADGQEVGEERDAVAALMAHKQFGRRFWIQGHEPGTLYPRPVDFRRDLRAAGIELREEDVLAMLEQERKTHGRVDLLEEAEDTLAMVRSEIEKAHAAAAAREAEEQAQAAKPKAKPKAAPATV